MDGAGFRSLIVFLLLAILAFIAGSLASENAVGALAPTAIVLGLFFLIYLGKNCWVLVFIVPPVLNEVNLSFLKGFPVPYLVCGVVLFYMLILYMMGYIKIKWNGILMIDVITLVFCLYFVSTYIRHPVTLNVLTSITDYGYAEVGGKEYLFLVACMLSYLALSIVSVKFDTLLKTLKWAFLISAFFVFFNTLRGVMTGSITLGDEVSNSRFGAFAGIGQLTFRYLLAKYSFMGVVLSPVKLVIVIVSLLALLLSGFRTLLISSVFYSFAITCIYKQLFVFIMMGMFVWGGFVYISHEAEEFVESLPFGIQRALSVIPGVVVSEKAAREAKQSSEWRLEMWKWAMDPSTGYIKDYVWGDGYGRSMYVEKLRTTALSLGIIREDNKIFAARGLWHNGAIHLIHRLGYVGLSIVYIWNIIILIYIYQLCCYLRPIEGKEYIYIIFVPVFEAAVTVWFLPTESIVFICRLYEVALYKIIYLSFKDAYPMLIPDSRTKYTPQIFHELNQSDKIMRIS